MKHYRRLIISALLTSGMMVLSAPPISITPLVFFALVPWLLFLESSPSLKQNLMQSHIIAALMTFGSFSWIAYAIPTFGGLPIWVGILALFLFSFVCQLQFIGYALVRRWITLPRSRILRSAAIAAIYTAIDFSVPKLFKDSIGHHLYSFSSLRQLSEITGVAGITFLIVFFNASLCFGILEFVKSENKTERFCSKLFARILVKHLTVTIALCLIVTLWGHTRYKEIKNAPVSSYVNAAAIQANIGDIEKIAAESGHRGAAEKVIQTYRDLSDAALIENPKLDFLVWPETAYPSTFGAPRSLEEISRERGVREWVQKNNVPLFMGGYDTSKTYDFNAFFFLHPSMTPPSVYRKTLLLPFGEFMPGAERFTWLKDAFPTVGNFGRGKGPEIFQMSSNSAIFSFVPAICYEVLYDEFIRKGVRSLRPTLDPDFILNITNDSWFGTYGEPYQHLALSTFRAIETRLPLLRVTNTGVSALILPDGTIQNPTEIETKLYRIYSIPKYEKPLSGVWNVFIRMGSWFYYLCLLMCAGLVLYRVRK